MFVPVHSHTEKMPKVWLSYDYVGAKYEYEYD